jgi:hypothetical protein
MRVYPTLFRRLKCWDDESLKGPWLTHPLSELYDSTSSGAGYAINLYDLSVYVVQNGGSDSITHRNQWEAIGKVFNIISNYLNSVWKPHFNCYEVYTNHVVKA